MSNKRRLGIVLGLLAGAAGVEHKPQRVDATRGCGARNMTNSPLARLERIGKIPKHFYAQS